MLALIKERCTLLGDFWDQGSFFFEAPTIFDKASVKAKWNEEKKDFFKSLIVKYNKIEVWNIEEAEKKFKQLNVVLEKRSLELERSNKENERLPVQLNSYCPRDINCYHCLWHAGKTGAALNGEWRIVWFISHLLDCYHRGISF